MSSRLKKIKPKALRKQSSRQRKAGIQLSIASDDNTSTGFVKETGWDQSPSDRARETQSLETQSLETQSLETRTEKTDRESARMHRRLKVRCRNCKSVALILADRSFRTECLECGDLLTVKYESSRWIPILVVCLLGMVAVAVYFSVYRGLV